MSTDAKRNKKKGGSSRGDNDSDSDQNPSKQNISIAKYLQSKLPRLEGKLCGQVVNIFIASVALDLLMQSQWAVKEDSKTTSTNSIFTSRLVACNYMKDLLRKGLFHRAEKIKKTRKNCLTGKVSSNNVKATSAPAGQIVEQSSQQRQQASNDIKKSNKKNSAKNDGKKARMKLEFHSEQDFVDGDDVYVWVYESIHWWNYLLGALILILIFVFCLFPLWPSPLRSGSYYAAMLAAGLFGLLLALGLLRVLIFSLFWCFSFGNVHFWLFPNLFADCGVLDSFKPLWSFDKKESKSQKLESKKEK